MDSVLVGIVGREGGRCECVTGEGVRTSTA